MITVLLVANQTATAFKDVWTTAGSDTLPDIASGLGPGIYYLHVLPNDGSDGDVVSSNGFQLGTIAPQLQTARTSSSGFEIELVFSEPLSGTTLTDLVANAIEGFNNQKVENVVSGAFVENSVTVEQGSYLTATTSLLTDVRSTLFFASLTQDASFDARLALATWRGTAGAINPITPLSVIAAPIAAYIIAVWVHRFGTFPKPEQGEYDGNVCSAGCVPGRDRDFPDAPGWRDRSRGQGADLPGRDYRLAGGSRR